MQLVTEDYNIVMYMISCCILFSFLFIKYSWVITYLYTSEVRYIKMENVFCIINYGMEEIYREISLRTPFNIEKFMINISLLCFLSRRNSRPKSGRVDWKMAMVVGSWSLRNRLQFQCYKVQVFIVFLLKLIIFPIIKNKKCCQTSVSHLKTYKCHFFNFTWYHLTAFKTTHMFLTVVDSINKKSSCGLLKLSVNFK